MKSARSYMSISSKLTSASIKSLSGAGSMAYVCRVFEVVGFREVEQAIPGSMSVTVKQP